MPLIIPAKTIGIGRFKALYFGCAPPRLEAAVVFDGDTLSQKLVFQMMDISWRHGFGCSAPQYEEQGDLVFSVGTTLPSSRSLRRFAAKLNNCLEEMADFAAEFARQLDFTTLDISMFSDIDPADLDLATIAAVRDQQYGGNWEALQRAMDEEGRKEESVVVGRCREFEKVNSKDIGLVGHKLLDTLAFMAGSVSTQN
jgi:hypothetical protein